METQAKSCLNAMTSPDYQKSANCTEFGKISACSSLEIFEVFVLADKIRVYQAGLKVLFGIKRFFLLDDHPCLRQQ